MRYPSILPLAFTLLALGACGPQSRADLEEIKKGQKDILAKLDALDKTVQQMKAAPAAAAARPPLDPNKVYPVAINASPVKGPRDAKVTIAEFADFQCPFCAQSAPLVEEVLKQYPKDVNFVFKQFPLTSIHANALGAAKAALAAGKQGKYWQMHDVLFQNSRELGADKLEGYAAQAGLDVARWKQDMNAPEIQDQITKEAQEARAADVTGTPSYFVNGKRVMNRSVDGFKQLIDEALKAKS